MKNNVKKHLLIIAFLVLLLLIILIILLVVMNIKKPIKIGVIISLSGPAVAMVDVRDSMILAADEVNSRGGINNRKIKLIFEDSKTDPNIGMEAFRKIEKAEKPLLYAGILSSVSMALAPLAEEKKVVLMGMITLNPNLTKNREWVFHYYYSTETEVQPILSIIDMLKIKNIGLLYLDDELGNSILTLLKNKLKLTDIILQTEAFQVTDFDYHKEISGLFKTKAIYAVGYSNHIKEIFIQLDELEYKGLKMGSSGAGTDLVKKQKESQGAYIAASIIYNKNFPFVNEISKVYSQRYKKSFTHHAAVGYDFIKILAGLLEDQEITRENVRKLLESGFSHPGITGYLEVKAGSHELSLPLFPALIKNGELEFIYD